jgi:hypothetical protein
MTEELNGVILLLEKARELAQAADKKSDADTLEEMLNAVEALTEDIEEMIDGYDTDDTDE